MKKNGWKALVAAATIFLTSACYSLDKNEKEDNSIPTSIEVLEITPFPVVESIPTDNSKTFISTESQSLYRKSTEEIAKEVILGNWGNGEQRKQLLAEAGYDYNEVMAIVNELLGYSNNAIETPNISSENYQTTPDVQNQNIVSSGQAAYVNADVVVYDINNNPVHQLSKYDKVILTNEYNGSKRLVTIPYVYQGFIESNNLVNLPGTYIEVDISLQVTRMFIDDELVFEANVITGNPNKGTIPGTNPGYTQIYAKNYQTYLVGDGYREYVDVFMPFNNHGEGFHDADGWRSDYEFDDKTRYLTNGSHGCVNMKDNDASTLSQLAEVGTPVLVHK